MMEKRRWRRGLALLLMLGFWLAVAPPAAAQEMRFFRIGTGHVGGAFFPIGGLLGRVISSPLDSGPCEEGGNCGVPGLIGVTQSTSGSVANLAAIGGGRLASGLVQADIAHWAYFGTQFYEGRGRASSLRVIANLFRVSVHLVARRGAGIRRLADLVGKRVSLDTAGSGTQADALIILAAHQIDWRALDVLYLAPEMAAERLLEGRLDAFFFIGGYPASAISDLASRGSIDLVALAGTDAAATIQHNAFFVDDVIPAGTYEGIGETATLGLGAQWLVGAGVDEELVFKVTQALWHPNNRRHLDNGHVKGRQIRLETALSGITLPLHPGAERYYRNVGIRR